MSRTTGPMCEERLTMPKSSRISEQERRVFYLDQGNCPVHRGHAWFEEAQKAIWYLERDPVVRSTHGMRYTIVTCPTEGCGIQAKKYSDDGPYLLLPEWEYILSDSGNGPYFPDLDRRQTQVPLPLLHETYGQRCPSCN